jgi:hypothetical protein
MVAVLPLLLELVLLLLELGQLALRLPLLPLMG